MPRCELCERDLPSLTVHHLIPRAKGKRGQELPTVPLCSACHRQLHALFSNDELARSLHSLDRLREHADVQRYVKWVRKQPPGRHVRVRR